LRQKIITELMSMRYKCFPCLYYELQNWKPIRYPYLNEIKSLEFAMNNILTMLFATTFIEVAEDFVQFWLFCMLYTK